MPTAPRMLWRCGSATASQRSATRRRTSSPRSGPSATCSPAACCTTATRRRLRAGCGPWRDHAGADAGRGIPGGLHRAAPAERPRRRDPAFQHARRSVQGGDHPGSRVLLAGSRGGGRRARIRGRTTNAPPHGPPRSMASLRHWRWATMPRHWRAGSRRCTIRPTRATRCWRSPTGRWCVPRPCWSRGTIRNARAPSCCGWTSSLPTRPTAH